MADGLGTTPEGWDVPPFDGVEIAPRTTPRCVLIPVVNEGDRLRRQLERMAALEPAIDVVIVDGGSDDGCSDPAVVEPLGVRAILRKRGGPGLGSQLRIGFAWALEQGYEGIVTIDGNGKDGVEAIPRFAAALADGWDFVQGSRYVEGGRGVNTPLDRHLGVRLLHAPVLSLGARFRYTDTTNGFRAFSARLLRDDRVRPFRAVFETYNLHYYLAVRAARLGFRVRELPVARSYPATGGTPTRITSLAGRLELLKQLLGAVTGAYDP